MNSSACCKSLVPSAGTCLLQCASDFQQPSVLLIPAAALNCCAREDCEIVKRRMLMVGIVVCRVTPLVHPRLSSRAERGPLR